MARLKLPPYAKALLDSRRKGEHPWKVLITFGDKWVYHEKPFRLHIPADTYKPGMYDFACVSGVAVDVAVYGDQAVKDFQLGYELAQVAAPVRLAYQDAQIAAMWASVQESDIAGLAALGDKVPDGYFDFVTREDDCLDIVHGLWLLGHSPTLLSLKEGEEYALAECWSEGFERDYQRRVSRLYNDYLSFTCPGLVANG